MGKIWTAVVGVIAGFAAISAAQDPAKQGVKTDRSIYPLPEAPALPEARGTFIDPTFGTTVMRVTDEADGKENNHAYSYWPSFNLSNTFFHIHTGIEGGTPMLYRFDPKGFEILGKEPLFPGNPTGDSAVRWEDSIWSGTNGNALYCHTNTKLWQFDVVEKEYALVRDFTDDLPEKYRLTQMSKSTNDNVFAFSVASGTGKHVGHIAWRRDSGKTSINTGYEAGIDEVQVDKSGGHLVIKTGQQGKDRIEVEILDLSSGGIEELTDSGPDFAPGHSDNGNGTVIGSDNWENRITSRELETPHQFSTVLELKDDWAQDYHISMLADNESRVLASFYNNPKGEHKPSGVFLNEVVLIATDGSQDVFRLAHHRSVYRDYWDSPRANISRDGKFVMFTSNFAGKGQRDVFILKMPPENSMQAYDHPGN